jgi:hypothetical protein
MDAARKTLKSEDLGLQLKIDEMSELKKSQGMYFKDR